MSSKSGIDVPLRYSFIKKLAAFLTDHELALYPLIVPLLLFPNRFSPIGLALIALSWIARWYIRGTATLRTPLDVPILVLMTMTLVSFLPSADLSVSWPKFLGVVLGIAVFYATVNGIKNEAGIRSLALVLPVLGVLIALLSLVGTNWAARKVFYIPQMGFILPSLTHLMPKSVLPAVQVGFHPNEVGGALAMIFPVPVALFLGTRDIRRRWFYALTMLVMAVPLALAQSRSAWMGLGTVLLALAIWRERRFILALPVLVVAVMLWGGLQGFSGLGDFLFAVDQATNLAYEGAVISRVDIWATALAMIQDFPYTGIGLNNFPFVFDTLYPSPVLGPDARMPHAHNLYLQTAVDLGIIGLLAFVSMLVSFWILVARTYRLSAKREHQCILVGNAAGVAAYLVYGVTDTFTLGAKPGVAFWFMIALGVTLHYHLASAHRKQKTSELDPRFNNQHCIGGGRGDSSPPGKANDITDPGRVSFGCRGLSSLSFLWRLRPLLSDARISTKTGTRF